MLERIRRHRNGRRRASCGAPSAIGGYVQFKSPKEVTDEYVKYARQLLDFIDKGFTGAVYTQTTDVEIEVNDLYDL